MKISHREMLPVEKNRKSMRHASTLLVLPDGSLLCAWFAGSYEAEPDVDIYMARRNLCGQWSMPERVSAETGIAHWNPVLSRRNNGEILLFYKVGFEIAAWRTMVRVSSDNGHSWGPASELVPGDKGGRGPVRNKILVARDGTWIAGSSLEQGGLWTAFADISKDEGRSWTRGNILCIPAADNAACAPLSDASRIAPTAAVTAQSYAGRGIIQPSLWQSADGQLHMLLRSTEGYAYRSDCVAYSKAGSTWSAPFPTSIPNNNSGLDLVCLNNNTLVLAHNPVAKNWGARTPLVLSISTDGGTQWEQALTLDKGEGEFSYPALVAERDTIYITWTWNRKTIAFAQVNID